MKVEIEFTNDLMDDMLVTAIEGGSNYWYLFTDDAVAIVDDFTKRFQVTDKAFSVQFSKAIQNGARIPVNDLEEPDEILGSISMESIKKGVETMAKYHHIQFNNMITDGGWDAETADVFFQLCLMGEVVFG